MIMAVLKKQIGLALLEICEHLPRAKRVLLPLGLRTSPQWFHDRVVTVQGRNGREFRVGGLAENYLSYQLFWLGAEFYEPVTSSLVEQLTESSGTFYDVGANIGYYSLLLGTARPSLEVVAFEPNPKMFSLLKRNVSINRLANVSFEPFALSDIEGCAPLFLSKSDMSASLYDGFEPTTIGQVIVPTTTLDVYSARRQPRGTLVIKVDVEGHEEACFRGARRTIEQYRPDIIIEVAMRYLRNPYSELRNLGYRFYQITDQGLTRTDRLAPVVRPPFAFFNYLFSVRPPRELHAMFDRIRPHIHRVDLLRTSKNVGHEMIHVLQSRPAPEANSEDDMPYRSAAS